MVPEKTSPEGLDAREPGQDAERGESRSQEPLSPALTRAIVEQLVRHGRELGRREMIDFILCHGGKLEGPEPR